ncbi:DUF1501 domain-containing protein [Lignipirellula cremea]|uniref:DUF1501 domain-containing protein n=1 Tax=Lignipirellula cremea TaxID=2528010 RepID=A0A518E1Q7_9BACT|nr:DUF1501 domain-containing protein [Lignipirellula cremea]QDU98003.1 hypothetical protein Pla8534_58640 [Lignipirellula cremea]
MKCMTQDHLSRRALLKGVLGTAAGGTVMNWGALARSAENVDQAKQKQKRCILLWMNGGASQFETFDPKPESRYGGLFRPISTNVAGTQICELMPTIAQKMDKLCVIRSMRTSQVDHNGGIYLMHTGYQPSANVRFPEIGAIAAKYLGNEDSDLPNFVKISSNGNAGSGFLGPKYQPFNLGSDGRLPTFAQSNLDPKMESRRNALRSFVEDERAELHRSETARMHRESYAASRRLQSGLPVFDFDDEWAKYENLYGDSQFGRRCLLARRLIETGVPFVEVGQSSYDTHADNFTGHKGLVPPMEFAWAGLLTDLEQRGLLDDTLVVWMGEIGRTPNINNRSGRDHYVRAWSTALAGGGVKGGLVYGATDEDGVDVADNLVSEGDYFATIYQALGVNPHTENYQGSRPIPLAPFGSKVVSDLLA